MPADAADVIVVGAGPAGAATALLLARAGIRVQLLDRHLFPRVKPCGDCLSAGASAVLRRLGLLDQVLALPHARLEGWSITAPDGRSFTARFDATDPAVPYALAIERSRLDSALVHAAANAGVDVRPGMRVSDVIRDAAGAVTGIVCNHGVQHARAVIGADGLRSVIATRVGALRRAARVRKLSLTAHLEAPGLASSFGEMHVGDGVVAGIAALDVGSRCNVTVVADARRFGSAVAADRTGFAWAALESLPRLRGRVPYAPFAAATVHASGPFDRPTRTCVFAGGALVGDAAGYFDPFTGQGMYQALASAELLAPALSHALEHGAVTTSTLRAYSMRRRKLLSGARAVQRGIDFVLSRPLWANRAVARIARAQRFGDTLVAVTGDIERPIRLLSPRTMFSLFDLGIRVGRNHDDGG